MMLKKSILALMVITLAAGAAFSQLTKPSPTTPEKKANSRPELKVDKATEPFENADAKTMASQCVTLDTEAGVIEMEMFPESAPQSVRNFLNLVSIGAFDTTTFSRVVPGFVVQGGNIWTREGGVTRDLGMRARRTVPDEPGKILHERGIVSMARSDEPNTATTNFFILVSKGAHLDGKFAAFGRVTKGMEVADAINMTAVTDEKPEKPVRIRKASVSPCVVQ